MSALKRPEESEIGRNNSLELELGDFLSDPTTPLTTETETTIISMFHSNLARLEFL